MRWRLVPLLMGFAALAHFNRISISVAGAEQIIRPGFLGKEEMGVVYSAFLLSYTLFMIPGGWFIDRFGPRAAWMVVGFGSAAGAALTGTAGLVFSAPLALLGGLLVVRSLTGACNSPLHPSAARLVANWVPPEGATLANGLINGAACAGIALTPYLFGKLIDSFGWPQAFLFAGGLTLLGALVWTFSAANHPPGSVPAKEWMARGGVQQILPRTDVQSARQPDGLHIRPANLFFDGSRDPLALPPAGGFLPLLRNAHLLCLTASYAMLGYFEYLFFYWAQFYFEQVLHLPKETGRLYTGLLIAAMGVGMGVGGRLSDWAVGRLGARAGLAVVPVVGLLLAAAATVLGAFAAEPTSILACFATAMGMAGLGEGSYWTASVRIGGARGGTAAAILNTGGNAGGLLAPVLTPYISDWLGWHAGLGAAGIVCLAGAVLWGGVAPDHYLREPRRKAEEDGS
jgi:ACS family D-galactonate transporter-like MFS transporter